MNRAVFIDKDGTLIKDVPYNVDPSRVEFYEEVGPKLKALKDYGFMLILVSNQSGIARGYFKETEFFQLEKKIQSDLARDNVQFDAIYFCPHHPEGSILDYAIECDCRKPKPGMLLMAARQHNIILKQSWMIGDILHDVEAGNKAGCKTVLIDNGNETEWRITSSRLPTKIATTFSNAVDLILTDDLLK